MHSWPWRSPVGRSIDKIVYNTGIWSQTSRQSGRFRIQITDYTQGDAFQAEKRAVFAKSWLPLCAEGQVARAGDFLAASVGGWSVVATRDRDGDIHVLRNACRHQNMPVVGAPSGTCESFRCRFHGWVYDLQGRFVSAPAPVAPTDPLPGANDLQSLPVRVTGGLVFFSVEPAATEPMSPTIEQAYAGTIVTDMGCNWKICVEHLLGDQDADAAGFAWIWPLLAVRRTGPSVLVDQVVPHTFLRTKLFTHVFGGPVEAQKPVAAAMKSACEALQAERASGTPAEGGSLLTPFHRSLEEAYGNS